MRYEAVAGHLDERGLRLFAASEARAAGRGGIAAVSQITGIARSTIGRGLKDLEGEAAEWPYGRARRSGGGRKAATVSQPGLRQALLQLVASATRGDPQAVLLWVSRSQRHLASALAGQGFGPGVVSFAQNPGPFGDGIQAVLAGDVPDDVVPNTCN